MDATAPAIPWLVATDDDHVIGVAYAGPWNERLLYRWTVESTIYVDPSAHRRGVGDAPTPSYSTACASRDSAAPSR